MAVTQFDITSLYERAFGVSRGRSYDSGELYKKQITTVPDSEDYQTPSVSSTDTGEFVRIRQLLNAKLPTGRDIFLPVQIGDLLLPNEPTLAIATKKNIVETALVGSTKSGTVKELIALEDYEITIRGIAINYESKKIYPETQVKDLHTLFRRNEALPIICGLTELLGVKRIVIKEFRLPEMTGVQHAQAYELVCVSDAEFVLEL
jgi:hypothetical protein